VNQLGGVQRLPGALPLQPRTGDTAKLAIDDLNQDVECRLVTAAPLAEECCDVLMIFDS
jgi:hypothetical protein